MKPLKSKSILGFEGLFGIFILMFLAGCAHTVVVAPKPPATSTEKIPTDVGLYMSDEFKNYKVSESRMGDRWDFTNLGEASSMQFRVGLGQIFRTVEMVDEKPPFSKPKVTTLQAVIEPKIEWFDFGIPMLKFQVYRARIGYKITVYDMSGKLIFSKSIEGIGDTPGSPGFDFTENPSRSASKAVEDGINKAVEAMATSEEIRPFFKKE